MSRWVYNFGRNQNDGSAALSDFLGGKGANLAEMASLGLPVPPGFTITTQVCTHYYKNEESYPKGLKEQVGVSLSLIEKEVGTCFGDVENPLFVSVRSGARVSMPGMMDTVLNLGLNDETVQGLARKSGDERFAWDSYRRFIQMYSDVVLGVGLYAFEDILDSYKREEDITLDTQITAQGWKDIVQGYKALVLCETGEAFPVDPYEQLWGAIGAVFKSWMVPRAVTYRRIHEISDDWGTAVNVQAMVFGNMGEDCATGVAFTRDPSTGENYFYGEYLVNAQGEDVVAGIRTPQVLSSMKEGMPDVYAQLNTLRLKLEAHYRDVQDIEFTVQQGQLYMLQTRTGKRTAGAALKIAVDMVEEGVLSKEEALLRVDPASLDQLLHPLLDPDAPRDVVTRGLPASPGAASGVVVFTSDEAEKRSLDGETVILCRQETSPEDIHGMHASQGILTSRGGMTSHAAVVARGMGKPCVAGAGDIHIDQVAKVIRKGDIEIEQGDIITLDGSTGEVILGAVPSIEPELSEDFSMLMGWADDVRRMGVRANAETPSDASMARGFGAQGIGLCRTEHMFFDSSRIQNVREMIFVSDDGSRRAALSKLLPEQRGDFEQLFEIMQGLPVTVRLLDPPLHEFLPHSDEDIAAFSKAAGIDEARVRRRLGELTESNPMLGHRGCRLGVTYPEIYEMQARAIFEAALSVQNKTGSAVVPEIMIPLVGAVKELELMRSVVDDVARAVFAEKDLALEYLVGTMIELPRAALTADEIAGAADFFSFGTNDLTQTTLGMSRDAAGSFLPIYTRKGIYERDPFVSIDVAGVGALVEIGVNKGKSSNAALKVGICGEHGGDPASIAFCESVGMSYVSCSPYRVPIARLAAAQATLRQQDKKVV